MRHLNTPPLFNTSFEEINSKTGVIKGVAIATLGEIKGHGVWADSKFLSQIVEKGKEYEKGVKARFGHPNMSSTALGTYLGRFKNFRKSGEQALADLYIDQSSKKSPNGNLYDYIFSMASENPDMFGASIVFAPAKGEFKGTGEKDSEGNEIEREYARISQLLATDLVDEPAANDGLFETFSHDDIASQVTEFLDLHPEVWEIAEKHPEVMEGFMTKYNEYKQRKESKPTKMENLKEQFESLKTWMSDKIEKIANPENTNSENNKTELSVTILDEKDVQNKFTEFETLLNAESENNTILASEKETLTTDNTTLKSDKETLETEKQKLQDEVDRLKGTSTKTKDGEDVDPEEDRTSDEGAFGRFVAGKVKNHLRL